MIALYGLAASGVLAWITAETTTIVQDFLKQFELQEAWSVAIFVDCDAKTDTFTITTVVYDEKGVEVRRTTEKRKTCQGHHSNLCK